MSELLLFGVSHKTAPVALRERLALTQVEAERFLREVVTLPEVREAAAISTCNRTELYMVVGDPVAAESAVLGRFATRAGIRPTELADVIYSPRNCDAARQLFRVASGLESMIVGESEVQGQVRRAYETALEAGVTGPLSNRLFTSALTTGKRVRAETAISQGRASISSVAVDLAEDVIDDLEHAHVVIIGAGETSELTAQALAEKGVKTVFVANRHAARARSVAQRFGGAVVSLDALPAQLVAADIVVASTSSPHPIVESEDLAEVIRQRNGRPLVMVDLAVPRDIDPACADLPGVTVYDIDDLQGVVARTLEVRAGEASRAEEIVEEEIQRFAGYLGGMEVLPTIGALRAQADAIVDQVLAENAGKWESASPRDLNRVEAIARASVNRLLHEPTIRLRAMGSGSSHGRLALLRELFGLERGDESDEDSGNVRSMRP
jgi:glutamyl-tRNA reductase